MIDPTSEVWIVDLAMTEPELSACLSVLSSQESERAARFLRSVDRDRFVASHAALRLVLAGALDAEPRDLTFGAGPAGKPELAGSQTGRVHFNLSHSGGRALVGLSTFGRIGVDVEVRRPMADALRIARAHFTARESDALARCDAADLTDAFLACWTRKEAFVKAAGAGLSMPLDRFVVSVPPAPVALISIDGDVRAARRWTLHHLEPADGYVGAVAIEAVDAPCHILVLPADWATTLRPRARLGA